MTFVSLLLAAAALAVGVVAAARPASRATWREIGRLGFAAHVGVLALAVVVSLVCFDAIDHHAFRAHEASLWDLWVGTELSEDQLHPLEVHPLLAVIYGTAGPLFGGTTTGFVVMALLLGGGGLLFAGLATQLLTGRLWAGLAVGLLLATLPGLVYWRVHAFHVAISHATWAATLLAAVLVARRTDRLSCAAWMLLGALTLHLRSELAGAVVGTAAIPMLLGEPGAWRRWKVWAPGFGVAALLLALPTWQMLSLVHEREDYRLGLYMIPTYLRIPALWIPLATIPGALLAMLSGWAAANGRVDARLRTATRAAWICAACSLVPPLAFMSLGQRHLLPMMTAALIACVIGLVALIGALPNKPLAGGVAALLLVGAVASSGMQLADWSARYGTEDPQRVPALAGVAEPEGRPEFDAANCATYASHYHLCEQWDLCHPPKDMTDRRSVRARWDQHGGCVVWAVDATDGEVAGARHEWWSVVTSMYDWEPLGRLDFNVDGADTTAHVYRMTGRP